MNSGSVIVDETLRIYYGDEVFYKFIDPENFLTLAKSIHPDELERVNAAVDRLSQRNEDRVTFRMLNRDGEYRWVVAKLTFETSETASRKYIRMEFEDTSVYAEEVSVLQDENLKYLTYLGLWKKVLHFQYLVDTDEMIVFKKDVRQGCVFKGTISEWIAGQAPLQKREGLLEDFIGQLLQSPSQVLEQEILLAGGGKPENKAHYLMRAKTVDTANFGRMILGNIVPEARGEEEDKEIPDASIDVTTGVLDKKAIIDYCRMLISHASSRNVYLCILDVDNFKYINDTFGHLFGDEVLYKVAEVVRDAVKNYGVVGRIGGDEMMIVLDNIDENDKTTHLRGILRAIRSGVEWLYKGQRDDVTVTCSIGAARFPANADNYDDLFKIADKMLYRAKEKGRNRYIIYTPELHGDMISGENELKERYVGALRQDRESLVLGLMELMLVKQSMSFQIAFEQISAAFDLDAISVYYGNPGELKQEWYWSRKNIERSERFVECIREDFQKFFNGNGMAEFSNVELLEMVCPEMFHYFKDEGITAVLVYKLQTVKHEGYITYCKTNPMARKWAKADEAYLNFISKIIEIYIGDN